MPAPRPPLGAARLRRRRRRGFLLTGAAGGEQQGDQTELETQNARATSPGRQTSGTRSATWSPQTPGDPSRNRPGRKLAPGLYLVATPIGNLEDLTRRAERVLATADLVACEDRRVTSRLLHHLGLRRPLALYHEHNAAAARPELLARLRGGPVGGPGQRCRHARRSPTRASSWCATRVAQGSAVYPIPGPVGRAGGAGRVGPADRPVPVPGLPAAAQRRAAARARRSWPPCRRPWSCSNRRSGWPRCWPTPRPCSARARPRSRAS